MHSKEPIDPEELEALHNSATWMDLRGKTGKTDDELVDIISRVEDGFDAGLFLVLDELASAHEAIAVKVIKAVADEQKTDKAVVAAINSMVFGMGYLDDKLLDAVDAHLANAGPSMKKIVRSSEEIDKDVDELLNAGFFDNDEDRKTQRIQRLSRGAREEKEARETFSDLIAKAVTAELDKRNQKDSAMVAEYAEQLDDILKGLPKGQSVIGLEMVEDITPNKRAQNEQEPKVLLTSICDESNHVANVSKVSSSKDADNNPSLNFNFKEEITMTTPENKTTAPEATTPATPHVISTGIIDLSKRIQEVISIDSVTGVASYGSMKFKDTLPENLPEEQVLASLAHMNILAIAATHATGMAASKFIKDHPELKGVTGKFPGPNRGAHLDVSYKATTTMPSGDGTKVFHGTVVTAWKGVGGPGGNDYDAVKAAVRAASEAEQAN